MDDQKGSFSPFQTGAIIVGLWLLVAFVQWNPKDFSVPSQERRHSDKIVTYCKIPFWNSAWSGCFAILPNGELAKTSVRRSLAGEMIIVHSSSGEESINIPLGKFLKEGGHFIFDPRYYP